MIDTRRLFRPLCGEIVGLLRTLGRDDWERPTMAGRWRVRDIVAHLLDTALRRLSFHRDGLMPMPAERQAPSGHDLVVFINTLNETWVRAAERLSPRVLTDSYARASTDLADFVESLNLDAAAIFPVSWAGDTHSPQWLDIGREFTEVWHHGSQIRDAVISYFADRTLEELRGSDGLDHIKQALLKRLDDVVTGHRLKALFVTEFIVQ